MLSSSNLVAAGILLSRISGIVREQIIGVVLGGGSTTAALRFAMRVPNLLQNLLGEGSLSASFIPVYAKLLEDGEEDKARDVALSVLRLLLVVTSLLVAIIVLLARPLVWTFTSWESDPELYDLTTTLTQITTIGIGFLVISSWCLGILNSHRRFFLSYVAPVFWNVAQIGALLVAIIFAAKEQRAVTWVAWAVVGGGILQLAIQLPSVVKCLNPDGVPVSRSNIWKTTPELANVMKRFLPAVGARGVVQLSSLVDTILLGTLAPVALATYGFALPLYLLPISLFGFSVAAAELAEMSRHSDDIPEIVERLGPALKKVIVPAGFITSAYLVASASFVDALYGFPSRALSSIVETKFTDDTVQLVGLLLTLFALALPAAMTARVTQNTLYSLGNVKGPARIAILRLVVMTIISIVAISQLDWLYLDQGKVVAIESIPRWPLWQQPPTTHSILTEKTHLGVLGVAVGAVTASWVEWFLLRHLLKRMLGEKPSSGVSTQVIFASVASGCAMVLVRQLNLVSPIDAITVVVVGAPVYYLAIKSLGPSPMRS